MRTNKNRKYIFEITISLFISVPNFYLYLHLALSEIFILLCFSANFDRKGGRVCPEDCHNINFLHQLSYARFISRPPPHGIVKFPFLDKMNFTTRTERDDYIRYEV